MTDLTGLLSSSVALEIVLYPFPDWYFSSRNLLFSCGVATDRQVQEADGIVLALCLSHSLSNPLSLSLSQPLTLHPSVLAIDFLPLSALTSCQNTHPCCYH